MGDHDPGVPLQAHDQRVPRQADFHDLEGGQAGVSDNHFANLHTLRRVDQHVENGRIAQRPSRGMAGTTLTRCKRSNCSRGTKGRVAHVLLALSI